MFDLKYFKALKDLEQLTEAVKRMKSHADREYIHNLESKEILVRDRKEREFLIKICMLEMK